MSDAACDKDYISLTNANWFLFAIQTQPAFAPPYDMDGGIPRWIDRNPPRPTERGAPNHCTTKSQRCEHF
jgi:hypothetical protein